MAGQNISLTGVWHGLYSYQIFREPVYFVATLIDGGAFVSGTTHESEVGETGAPLTLFASIEGARQGFSIHFSKTYDGSDGWDHTVAYDGTLNSEQTEIDGRWTIDTKASGKFLMIRSRGATETIARSRFAKA